MNPYLIGLIVAGFVLIGGYAGIRLGSVIENKLTFGPIIHSIEAKYGLPYDLLYNLVDAESSFRSDIISGETKSSAGAVGIAQLMPQYYPHVDPTNPVTSLQAAAKTLVSHYRLLGNWEKAVAAYNWGIGNVQKDIAQNGDDWKNHLPDETADYLVKVMP